MERQARRMLQFANRKIELPTQLLHVLATAISGLRVRQSSPCKLTFLRIVFIIYSRCCANSIDSLSILSSLKVLANAPCLHRTRKPVLAIKVISFAVRNQILKLLKHGLEGVSLLPRLRSSSRDKFHAIDAAKLKTAKEATRRRCVALMKSSSRRSLASS